MSNLIKKQKQSLIIMIVTMIMIISALPVFSLATEVSDTKTPEITINVESGRVKGGTDVTITVEDESNLDVVYWAWDRRITGNVNTYNRINLKSENTNTYTLTVNMPTTPGVHELSVKSNDINGNIGIWKNIPYYVIDESAGEEIYEDTTAPEMIILPGFPSHESTIEPGMQMTAKFKDESGLYWIGYKWVRELNRPDYATGSRYVYNLGSEIDYTFTAPTELGTWYLQFYCCDGNNNISEGRYAEYYIEDHTAPTITLIGDEEVDVPLGTEYVDPGATWTDNYDESDGEIIYSQDKIDTSKVGTQILTYTVTDSSGNTATVTRKVTVVGKATYEFIPPSRVKTYR